MVHGDTPPCPSASCVSDTYSSYQPPTSLQHSMTPSTFVSTMASRSSSSLSSNGPYLYALVPALLILQAGGAGGKLSVKPSPSARLP